MSATEVDSAPQPVRSLVPARLDRLPWSRFHWMIVVGLGVSWILDGLEIQIVSQAGFADDLGLSSADVGALGSVYLVGQIVGALFFGRITDRVGRRKIFLLTLAIYLIGSGLAGLSWNLGVLAVFRFVAGVGIGGEYSAINSAIDELIPSHYRGRVDIAINGTYWGGAAIGAAANLYLLSDSFPSQSWGWRIGFFIGPVLGLLIIGLRRHIPESPRWQMTHGYQDEANATVDQIEEHVRAQGRELPEVDERKAIDIVPQRWLPLSQLFKILFRVYPRRTALGFFLMATQAFLYNAIFFSYALVLQHFFHVSKAHTSYYFLPFAFGNLLGPLILGPLFDTVGRRKMISGTYLLSGALLAVSAWLFGGGHLNATTQTILWCVIFFFASAGASSAYLTVSEIFPLELRGQAIAIFFSIAQGFGAIATSLYGHLIGGANNANPDRGPLTFGYYLGAGVMILGGVVAFFLALNAERQSLEDIADPLSKAPSAGGPATATV
ncbi:MFS transporter [Jatrophihabitans sp.]|uniref:MFS transporter n=1 Tax=Jatrophihabitans sp. TaxID=1932789 RepID=UPI002B6D5FAC|nr:MFS transporter [Jatrophihabitans sp.]